MLERHFDPSAPPKARVVPWLALALCLAFSGPTRAGANYSPTFTFPDDPYVHGEPSPQPGWIKFLILTSDPSTVYFQDSNLYPFHYDFAVNELPQFAGASSTEFDALTLYATNQQAILGAVLVAPPAAGVYTLDEYGIQLVRQDPYTEFETRDILQTVQAHIVAGPEVRAFYMPSLEQAAVAETHADFFAAEGFPVSSTARWADSDACYSTGWAVGNLKFVEAPLIDAAFLAGTLAPDDILLTDGVPAEIPQLAGVITLAPATPNSHVAILSQTFDIPFAHLALAEHAEAAQELVGRRVALRVLDRYGECEARVVDADHLPAADVTALLALKAPPPLDIDPIAPLGAYSASTDALVPADIDHFGGKAAHFGLLRQSIPTHCRVATAFSFDLWTEFLGQTVPGGGTLRERIDTTLQPFGYPPDVAALDAALAGLRDTIEDDTVFSSTLTGAVLATLEDSQYGFDPYEKIRFRSSTNVEDSEQFTGAGLYESKSGCLADDLDGDTSGPSRCDPAEPDERGVFRAIRRVYSSFYNLNPVIERLRHGIDEHDVGMALLVHHSFPDANELANGVVTLTYGPGSQRRGYLVAQPGANSVTNPEPGQIPEEVDLYISFSGTIYPTVLKPSNLVTLGDTVLEDPDEYVALTTLLLAAADHYATVSGLSEFVLEFEFKKEAPAEELVVTQIRRIPQSSDIPSLTPYLIGETTELCALQGEFGGTVFGVHRNKARWTVETVSGFLDETRLGTTGLFGQVSLQAIDGCRAWQYGGPLAEWPGYAYAFAGDTATDGWIFDELQHPRRQELQTSGIPVLLPPSEGPLVLLGDLGRALDYTDHGCFQLTTHYDTPLPDYEYGVGPTTTTTDYGWLCRCRTSSATDLLRSRRDSDGEITIDTSFYWPEPVDVAAGYTAPLIRFEQTTITGLTTDPIELTAPAAQTYKPGHHNFTEGFIFEPALEPSLTATQRSELESAGVRVLHARDDLSSYAITIYDDAAWGYHCLDCAGPDDDGDGRCLNEGGFDCDDTNPAVWARPGELTLALSPPGSLTWQPPVSPGAQSVAYDVLRADGGGPFTSGTCVATDVDGTSWTLDGIPAPGSVFFYQVRAVNACPGTIGDGELGADSDGTARVAASCP